MSSINIKLLLIIAVLAFLSRISKSTVSVYATQWIKEVSCYGTTDGDVITGTAFFEEIFAIAGTDTVYAFGGADQINGDEGSDFIDAGPGLDVVDGGSEDDTLVGDAGDDGLKAA
jgi:Ca2+-binding RTX toxin-like protein